MIGVNTEAVSAVTLAWSYSEVGGFWWILYFTPGEKYVAFVKWTYAVEGPKFSGRRALPVARLKQVKSF